MSCLVASNYTMQADIYTNTVTRNATNGMVSKTWTLTETINCRARGLLGSKMGGDSGQIDINNQINIDKNFIKIRCPKAISSTSRIVAIRSGTDVIWKEDAIPNSKGGVSGATIFEPRGFTPIIDFNGKVIEYEVTLERQEIQTLEGL